MAAGNISPSLNVLKTLYFHLSSSVVSFVAPEEGNPNDDLLWLPVNIMTVLTVLGVRKRLFLLLETSKPFVLSSLFLKFA